MSDAHVCIAVPPLILIITGLPGTGKTTLGKRLARELDLALISRDAYKEMLFDTLGYRDKAWSRQLGQLSYRLLYTVLETCLYVGRSVILESNFNNAHDAPQIRALQQRYPVRVCQIVCTCESTVLLRRLQRRWHSGERHRGHVDGSEVDALTVQDCQPAEPLVLDGGMITLDTTDFDAIDYAALVRWIRLCAA